MTNKEFVDGIKRLEMNYREDLDDNLKAMWFRDLKTLNSNRWSEIIQVILEREQFMPRLSTFIEINKELSNRIVNNDKQKVPCKICNGDGFVLYKQKNNEIEYEYVCKCKCANALKYKVFPSIEQVGLKV